MDLHRRIWKLKGVVQHYSWGGFDFIPRLLNIENNSHQPFAEYWMGAHANHPSWLQNEKDRPLDAFIASDPAGTLGADTARRFSSLPYLLKVLDVRQMLSIQVHPSKKVAQERFDAENRKGIPLNDPRRNYKDTNHKPELMVALGEFWLLHGFKKAEDIERILEEKKPLSFLLKQFREKGYRGLYEEVMLMDQQKVNRVLQELLKDVIPLYERGALSKSSEDFWAARAALHFCSGDHYDRGIFSIYLFNLVQLHAGEGIFQGSGMPHAYLEGQNVEVMANSDNVLRAGLTDKHVDVPELLEHVRFEATLPDLLRPAGPHRVFASPADEFELHQYLPGAGEEKKLTSETAELFLVMEGRLDVSSGAERSSFSAGDCFFVPAGTGISIRAVNASSVFRVTVPARP